MGTGNDLKDEGATVKGQINVKLKMQHVRDREGEKKGRQRVKNQRGTTF